MKNADFYRLNSLLKEIAATKTDNRIHADLVGLVRSYFHGQGPKYAPLAAQLAPLNGGFRVVLPDPQEIKMSSTAIGRQLDEAKRGGGDEFRPLLLKWLFTHHRADAIAYLKRWGVDAPFGTDDDDDAGFKSHYNGEELGEVARLAVEPIVAEPDAAGFDLIACLALSFGGLTAEELGGLLPAGKLPALTSLPHPVTRWIDERNDKSGKTRYSLFNKFLLPALIDARTAAVAGLLRTILMRLVVPNEATRTYAMRHLPVHLVQAGMAREALSLLSAPSYVEELVGGRSAGGSLFTLMQSVTEILMLENIEKAVDQQTMADIVAMVGNPSVARNNYMQGKGVVRRTGTDGFAVKPEYLAMMDCFGELHQNAVLEAFTRAGNGYIDERLFLTNSADRVEIIASLNRNWPLLPAGGSRRMTNQ